MAQNRRIYEFKIAAYTPLTMPMNRLAEYMADLASVLGEHDRVHFVKLKTGSTNLAFAVENEAEPKVRKRLHEARTSDSHSELTEAVRRINRRLASDNAVGELVDPAGESIVEFPGRKRFTQQVVGPFNQPRTVDGIPIMVGGELNTVPVHLCEEPGKIIHNCYATRAIAIEIAKFLYTAVIRAEGVARVYRDADGQWVCARFKIHDFHRLDDAPLPQLVDRMRSIPGGLSEVADPLAQLDDLRASEQAAG